MRIRTKILWILLSTSLLVLVVGGLAINRQYAAVTIGVTKEAENVARALGFVLTGNAVGPSAPAQAIVMRLHRAQHRDVVLLDPGRRIVADAVPAEIGSLYAEDHGGEVQRSLQDGKPRTFVETSQDYPAGIKQIVVPVPNEAGRIIGAVVLEYTPLYNELMGLTRLTVLQVAYAGAISVALALVIALYAGRSIAAPLQQLALTAKGFAAGQVDLPLPPTRRDEIGDLAVAFADMMQKRQQAEQELRRMRDGLEALVVARTAQLARTNESLLKENAERVKAQRQLKAEYAVSRILAESSTLDQAAAKMLAAICEILEWEVGILWLVDHRAALLRCTAAWGADNLFREFKADSGALSFVRGTGLPGRIWSGGQSAWLSDLRRAANFPRAASAEKAGLRSAFGFPVLVGSGVGGVLEFFSREVREPDEAFLQTCANLGGQIGHFVERRRVEDHLFQSQKMETIGKLAGGIAHEFNSIMTAIIFQSELMLADLPAANPSRRSAAEIHEAAGRAAALTRQLLAYGRKQFLLPEIINLNEVLARMEKMLLHLLGQEVNVRFAPATDLGTIKADVGQIEQVIVNIAMNAGEAMPNGGRITFETANVHLDAEYVSRLPELRAGEYVMLAITDTGPGMSEEVKQRLFEPFFTTKDVGKGAGLGLATCHGIIRQSGGHIAFYSEEGRGTTFRIYLPRANSSEKTASARPFASALPGGTETILLVEDDAALREAAATVLGRLGYKVLTAANGVEALQLANREGVGHIDLVFTDVVMPQMSGKELAERVRLLFPRTRLLFASAYTGNAIAHHGALEADAEFLQKPFPPALLATKVREVLDKRT